ncbi:MAG TPA: biotin carboxylase N-terminal domain-containing protein [Ktedonobacterales bacterium]|nr:biotin carboxylase N-terminal domain-containing protein [Ktedonobacterales bacterium]
MTKRDPHAISTAALGERGAAPSQIRLIRKVLVANRGEIACRVIRTCHAMGIASVAVFSDADAHAHHVREADEAIRLSGSAPSDSYLNISALLDAARRTGADAVHPGYGFLAEQAEFAAACRDAGLIFIGPAAEVIARMGSKTEARRMMAAAGLPMVPGYDGADQSDERFLAAAEEIGYPVMVKAALGGGGKGMRTVACQGDLPEALVSARREALAAFGDATLLLEKAIANPRHVEFQIFGDAQGNLIHLGERECSIQRRHQKIIEETPSPALTPELRARMAEAALTVGRQLAYTNAGTVEFILAPDGQFYFLEVNTRLQVEHPVTELVTGLDLVRWQMLVAEERALPLQQHEILFNGHAVEARVYAEDAENGFLPATGTVALWRPPTRARVDAGIETGDAISIYYDPLVAKISASGQDRLEALRRLDAALARTVLFGVRNNIAFLRRVLMHPVHVGGAFDTGFLERHAGELMAPCPAIGANLRPNGAGLGALVAALHRVLALAEHVSWRNNRYRPVLETFKPFVHAANGSWVPRAQAIEVRLTPSIDRQYQASIATGEISATYTVLLREHAGYDLVLEIDGHLMRTVAVKTSDDEWWVRVGTETCVLRWCSPLPEPELRASSSDSLAAPMPGQVVVIHVAPGQTVRAGDPLVVLEAMKMEHTIRAPHDGQIAAIHFGPGDQVPAAAVLLELRQLEF